MCYSRIWYEFRDPDITVLDIFTNFSSLNNKVVVSWNRDSCWCVFVNFIDAQTFECRTSRYAMNDIGSKSWINMIVFLIALGRHSHLQSTNRPFQSVWSHTWNAQRIRAKEARNKKKKTKQHKMLSARLPLILEIRPERLKNNKRAKMMRIKTGWLAFGHVRYCHYSSDWRLKNSPKRSWIVSHTHTHTDSLFRQRTRETKQKRLTECLLQIRRYSLLCCCMKPFHCSGHFGWHSPYEWCLLAFLFLTSILLV